VTLEGGEAQAPSKAIKRTMRTKANRDGQSESDDERTVEANTTAERRRGAMNGRLERSTVRTYPWSHALGAPRRNRVNLATAARGVISKK
jgi:hypothetical protein